MKLFTNVRIMSLTLMLAILAVAVPVGATPTNGSCQDLTLPVALAAGQPTSYQVQGTLCTPANATSEIDVLMHGGTYDRNYWDFPVQHPAYSYAQRTLQSGRAVFYFDHIGTGASSKPLSASVSLGATVYVTHQALQWVQEQGFSTVNLIGHSLGSYTAIHVAAQYPQDLDHLVLTSALHVPVTLPQLSLAFATSMYPATLDAQFQGQGLDIGYLTSTPGARTNLFYYQSTTDATVAAYDEAHKSVMSSAFAAGILANDLATLPLLSATTHITAPTLLVVGQYDGLFCNATVNCSQATAVQANEQPYYPHVASLTALTIPNTGHNLALHTTASSSFAAIDQWIQAQ